MRKRTKLRKRFQEAKSEQQKNKLHSDLVAIEGQLQASYQNELKEEERKAVEAIKTNSKFFYSYARRHNITQTKIGPLQSTDGTLTADNREMTNILSNQYAAAFSTPTGLEPDQTTI